MDRTSGDSLGSQDLQLSPSPNVGSRSQLERHLLIGIATVGAAGALLFALAVGRATSAPAPSTRAAGPPGSEPLARPDAPRPQLLSGTGLFEPGHPEQVHPDAFPYSPRYPLWTDGAEKRRWLRLAPGTFIDGSDPDRWVFPIGTRLWKEFSFERRVETRFMERLSDGSWRFSTYVWEEQGGDAELAAPVGLRGAAHLPGSELQHDVPSEQDCMACHAGRTARVLGVGAVQLARESEPEIQLAVGGRGGDNQLAQLIERGLLRGYPRELVRAGVVAPDATARAAAGYLYGNCSHCHNSEGSLRELGLDFDQPVGRRDGYARMVESVVERASRFRIPGEHESVRVAPGSPERSAVRARIATRFPAFQMPPLGTQLVDARAVALIDQWISTMTVSTPKLAKDPT